MIGPLDDDRDPVLDAFLDEMLNERHPPDLTSRILDAWKQRQSAASPSISATNGSRAAGPACAGEVPLGANSTNGSGRPKYIDLNVGSASRSGEHVVRGQRHASQAHRDAHRRSLGSLAAVLALMVIVGMGLGIAALQLTTAPQRVPIAQDTPQQPAELPRSPETAASRPAQDLADAPESPAPSGSFEEPPFGRERETREQPSAIAQGDWPAPLDEMTLVAFVDDSLNDLWREHQVRPSAAASDEQWCRRVFIRLLGRIPTVDELNAFVADADESKHARLVDRLQDSPQYAQQYARHWASFWTNVLIGRAVGTRPTETVSRSALENYLAEALLADAPFRDIAQRLLAAAGSGKPGTSEFDPAANFLLANYTPDAVQTTSIVSRIFMGQRAQCSQCHDHPSNPAVGQQHFWQLNAFFRQLHVERAADGQSARLVDRDAREDEVFYEQMDGYTRAAYPVFPDGQALPESGKLSDVNRRQRLAEWVAGSRELPLAVVNRVWSHFFGYGFTQPVDDMGPHNPPVESQLLEQLAAQFAAHDYSLKKLTRWIALSDAFRRSSELNEHNLADAPERGSAPLFSRYYTRRMQPEAVFESLRLIAEARQSGKLSGDADRRAWLGQFAPGQAVEEAQSPGSVGQSLTVMQAPLMQSAVSRERGAVLRQVLESDMSNAEKLEHLFLAAVARKPSSAELALAERMIREVGGPQTAFEDIWWALLNSNEFILDH